MLTPVHNLFATALPVILTVMLAVLAQVSAVAQQQEDVVPPDIALAEQSAALEAAINRIQKLQRRVDVAEAKATALQEALATANAESVEFSEAYQALRIKVEALGPELLEKGDSGIRGKLLSAVRDLGIVQKENERLADQLLTLTESIMAFLSSADEAKRADLLAALESELRSSDQLLGFRMDTGATQARQLESARVVSLKKDWGLIVLDSGSASGVKIGTPLQIVRADRAVGSAVIVDVRETISGAILTSPAEAEDPVRIGDGVRLAAAQTLQN